jgi:hypothetical protein
MSHTSFWATLSKVGWWFILVVFSAAGVFLIWAAMARPQVSLQLLAGALATFGVTAVPVMKLGSPTARRHAAAASDPNATLTVRRSQFALVLMVWAFVALAGACALGLAAGIEDKFWRMATWLGLFLFAALTVITPLNWGRMWLRLSPEGLEYSMFKIGPISWSDIVSVEGRAFLRTTFVALHLRDEQKYFQRGFKRPPRGLGWTRHLVPSEFMIPESAFDVPLEWLLSAIQIRLDRFGESISSHSPTVQRQRTTA